ncbi:MAG TPA: NAD(P)H-dependent oxidoreductase [Dongiaceae bacterium]|nr:NAD(P)H-dependent oxidoreductase [Dongiaceae bacterium]
MPRVLFVSSSLFGQKSQSGLIARELVDSLRAAQPDLALTERTLSADTIPHLSQGAFAAAMQPAADRSKEARAAAALADRLIEEVEAADILVIAAPMYNFSIPSTLKAWIDHITRSGRTFRYGANGPEGQLKGKKVFIVTARGGVYTDGPYKVMDFQEPYLRAVLGFIGLTDIRFIHVEGLQMSPEAAAGGIERARGELGKLVSAAAAA